MHSQADAPSTLRNVGTHLEGVIYTLYGVILHGEEEARGELRPAGASIEQSGGSMSEPPLRHEVICLGRGEKK